MQFLGLDQQQQQPNNTQNYKTGAGAINNVGGKSADKASDPLIGEFVYEDGGLKWRKTTHTTVKCCAINLRFEPLLALLN